MKRYPAYRESGVEWLGEVPEEWSISTLKHIVSTPITDGPHETPQFFDHGIPFVSAEAVSSGRINFDSIRGHISLEDHARYSLKYLPKRHDIFMIKSGATTGVTAIVETDVEFNIWSPLAVVRCGPKAHPYFVLNFMRSQNFFEAVQLGWSFGTQQNIGMGVIENLNICLPPLTEQTAIAAFLDVETAKIDGLVAEQRRLIDLLQEKRQAVISHAVTRGLNPHAKLKPSGIDWLGDVPESWEVKPLKRLTPEIMVGIVVEPSKYYAEEGVPALRSLNIKPGQIAGENLVFISAEANEFLKKSQLNEGDLVAVRTGQPGTCAVVGPEFAGCNCIDLIIVRKPTSTDSHFLRWYLTSDVAVRRFTEGSGGAIQQHFNVGMAVELVIAVPPLEEQLRIAAVLESQTAKLDALTATAESAISLLQERRAALISAAVTGKIDVRGRVPQTGATTGAQPE